jgi:hypothetical protein
VNSASGRRLAWPGSLLALLAMMLLLTPAVRGSPTPVQESVLLGRTTPGLLPSDGLLRVGVAGGVYGISYPASASWPQVDFRDLILQLEYGLRPGWHLLAELPYRQWSNGFGAIPSSGSGLADARVLLVAALPSPAARLGWALRLGTGLPTGSESEGLSEAKLSPEALLAVSLRFWERSQFPEMRLHLNGGYRWNRAEATGHGVSGTSFEPWSPLYPAVSAGGRDSDNDFLLWSAALEFRQATASLWLEYSEARLPWADGVADREQQRFVSAGLTWGRAEGLAVQLAYDVSLHREDYGTDFVATYPDLVTRLGVSYQFPLGGRDGDGDGIPDRNDLCPDQPEDHDGFADEDGCPDPDNDEDGVPDTWDGAPNMAEDLDGFQDEDGVPDYDNDGDGIPDLEDACPDVAEDLDGHRDSDGCPEEFLDADGDGIEDAEDRCPSRAEDLDGFEDEDGCPELDNDLDGIEDQDDACPDQPEDYDGVEDDDGCPDPPGKPTGGGDGT